MTQSLERLLNNLRWFRRYGSRHRYGLDRKVFWGKTRRKMMFWDFTRIVERYWPERCPHRWEEWFRFAFPYWGWTSAVLWLWWAYRGLFQRTYRGRSLYYRRDSSLCVVRLGRCGLLPIIRCLLSHRGRETLLTGLQYRTPDRLCQNRTFWMGLIDFYLIKSFTFLS